MPERIQLRRTKGWRKPEGAIVVARPSKWGNPFVIGGAYENLAGATPADVVWLYREALTNPTSEWAGSVAVSVLDIRGALAGHDLACWCALIDSEGRPVPCHADVLLEIANA